MNFDDERWVKYYVRDTPTYLSWTWQTRAVHAALLRKLDRDGRIEWPPRLGLAPLASALLIPNVDVICDALDELALSGTIVVDRDAGWLEMPAFAAAQMAAAPRSAAARTAEWRARKASAARSGDASVTPNVTRDAVTPRLEETRRDEREQNPPSGGAGGDAPKPKAKRTRKPPPEVDPRALPVLERIDEHRLRLGLRKLGPSERLDRHVLARLDEGVAVETLLAAVDVRAAAVRRNPAEVRWFDATSPFTGPSPNGKPGGWSVSCRLLDEHDRTRRTSHVARDWTPPGGETPETTRRRLESPEDPEGPRHA